MVFWPPPPAHRPWRAVQAVTYARAHNAPTSITHLTRFVVHVRMSSFSRHATQGMERLTTSWLEETRARLLPPGFISYVRTYLAARHQISAISHTPYFVPTPPTHSTCVRDNTSQSTNLVDEDNRRLPSPRDGEQSLDHLLALSDVLGGEGGCRYVEKRVPALRGHGLRQHRLTRP